MTEESNRCPKCDGEAVPIYYGYVPQSGPGGEEPEIVQAQERGELVLGGCVVRSSSPAWLCKKCNLRFGEHGGFEVVEPVIRRNGNTGQLD